MRFNLCWQATSSLHPHTVGLPQDKFSSLPSVLSWLHAALPTLCCPGCPYPVCCPGCMLPSLPSVLSWLPLPSVLSWLHAALPTQCVVLVACCPPYSVCCPGCMLPSLPSVLSWLHAALPTLCCPGCMLPSLPSVLSWLHAALPTQCVVLVACCQLIIPISVREVDTPMFQHTYGSFTLGAHSNFRASLKLESLALGNTSLVISH